MKYCAAVLLVLGISLCGPLRESVWSQAGAQAPAGAAVQKENPGGDAVVTTADPRVKEPARLGEALKETKQGGQKPQPAANPAATGGATAPAGKSDKEIEELKSRFRKLVDNEMKNLAPWGNRSPVRGKRRRAGPGSRRP